MTVGSQRELCKPRVVDHLNRGGFDSSSPGFHRHVGLDSPIGSLALVEAFEADPLTCSGDRLTTGTSPPRSAADLRFSGQSVGPTEHAIPRSDSWEPRARQSRMCSWSPGWPDYT